MSKRKENKPHFPDVLDNAVAERFPGVKCETAYNLFAMRYVSHWTDHEGNKLKPSLARRVKDWVEGFSEGASRYV